MAVAQAHRNVSISLPTELADQLDAWTAEEQTNRSAFITRLVEAERRRRCEAQLEEDVRDAVAEGFYDDIEFYLPAQAEVTLANPYNDEPEAR